MYDYDLGTPILGVILVLSVVALIAWLVYLGTLQKCLNRVSSENRGMSPGLVWLNLIPIFSLGWHIYTVVKISDSVKKEAAATGVEGVGDGGYGIGLAMCILYICGIIPFLGYVASVAALVCWIIYWVKINGISKKLEAPAAL